MPNTILYDVHERIATITLNRPERLNALSPEMQREIDEALSEAERDEAVRVVVIAGAGRAFCAGYDIAGTGDSAQIRDVAADRIRLEKMLNRWLRIWDATLPVIAKVHGYCLAGGSQLAIMCDVTIAAEDARVGTPQLPLGAGFLSPIWAWHVGPKKAKELLLPTGTMISGSEAARIGLFNVAVAADQLDQYVAEYAQSVAKTPKAVLALEKLAINRSQEVQGFRQAVLQGAEIDALAHATDAVMETKQQIQEQGLKAALAAWQAAD